MILDFIYIILFGLIVFLSYKKGFVKEAFNLIKFLIVIYFSPLFSEKILQLFTDFNLSEGFYKYISYVISFLILYILFSIIIGFLSNFINATPLSYFNRFLGIIFGICKSTIIIFIIFISVLIYSDYSEKTKEVLDESIISQYISIYLGGYNDIFPNYLKDKLDKFRKKSQVNVFKNNIIKEIEKGSSL